MEALKVFSKLYFRSKEKTFLFHTSKNSFQEKVENFIIIARAKSKTYTLCYWYVSDGIKCSSWIANWLSVN